MLATAGNPVSFGSSRVLSRAGISKLLGRYRLPRYSVIRGLLCDLRDQVKILGLWQEVFGGVPEEMRNYGSFDLECEFAGRVHHELFPVDLEYMDSVVSGGEDPFDYTIQPECFGIAWEMCDLSEIPEPSIPILAVLALSGIMEECDADVEDPDELTLELNDFWLEHAGEEFVWNMPTGWAGLTQLREALWCLNPPLNGLAVVVDALAKDGQNIFLSGVPTFWQGEYGDYLDWYCWCPGCIQDLSELYREVRPRIEAMMAYYEWYRPGGYAVNPESRRRVLAVLAEIARGEWVISDGEMIFYDGEIE
jgi:hypothetical protein